MIRCVPLLVVAFGCSSKEEPEGGADLRWEVDADRFVGDELPERGELFTVVAADMDADGDADVYLQRHHKTRSEVFENQDGTLVQVNSRLDDRSGLYDNPGVPDLYDLDGEMAAIADAATEPGLYVWHDEDPDGPWHFKVRGEAIDVRLEVNRPIEEVTGLDAATVVPLSDFALQANIPAETAFTLANPKVSTELLIETDATIYQGRQLTPDASGQVELWKNDPHGVAWVDQLGGPEPELFITRGGLAGTLVPPLDPKRDQWFGWGGRGTMWRPLAGIPADYCRGRQVTWIDVDHDGTDELFVSCTMTPNKLLDPDEQFADVAEEWGLDSVEPESFAWLDVDGDGQLDLVQNQPNRLEVMLRRGDRFEAADGEDFGLHSPGPQQTAAVFNLFTLQAFDHDRDGDLDLWASHWGDSYRVAVFRNDGGHFVDVTAHLALNDDDGFFTVIPVDVDRDGWLDVYAVSVERVRLFRNTGDRFSKWTLEPSSGMKDAAPADIDGDGRTDLVGVAKDGTRLVVFDRHESGGRLVRVQIDAPLGSLVRGYYADGSVQLHMHGGRTSRYSQVAEPIELGSGSGDDALVRVSLQRPGEAEGAPIDVGDRSVIAVP